MESFIKRTRARFSDAGLENVDTSSIGDRRVPPLKTQSFKGEKKKGKNWFLRQVSWKMNRDSDSRADGEYPTAVAAAAFAVNSLKESSFPDQKKTGEGPDRSLTKTKSKEDRTTRVSEPRTVSKKFSELLSDAVPDPTVPISTDTNVKIPEKAIGPASSIKETPTSADKHLKSTASTKPDSSVPKPVPATKQSTFQPTVTERQRSRKPGVSDSKADVWEKAEMAKIKERYEKLNATILEWENKKTTKSKRRLDTTERELEEKRAKSTKHYRNKMEMINKIAGGARAQAQENRRNEEFKVKEKSNKIRSTGKLPATCFCF